MRFSNGMEIEKVSKKRLSEIGGQEIINLYDGGKLGVIADVDLLINDNTGGIEALLIPNTRGFFSFRSDREYTEVPWKSVRKIGPDVLIVEIDDKANRNKLGL